MLIHVQLLSVGGLLFSEGKWKNIGSGGKGCVCMDDERVSWREGCRVGGIRLAEAQGFLLAPLLATGMPGLGYRESG